MAIFPSSWRKMKLGTQSSMGIINPRWRGMHDNYKQKLCHSLWAKQLRGWQAMLNMNMDHSTEDLVTDATAVLLKLVQRLGCQWWRGRKSKEIELDEAQSPTTVTVIPGTNLHHQKSKHWHISHHVNRSSRSMPMLHYSPPKTRINQNEKFVFFNMNTKTFFWF